MDDKVIFWDIGDTLGSARLARDPWRVVGVDIFPYVTGILQEFHSMGIRMGIISNTAPADTADSLKVVLEQAGIYRFFDPVLLIYSSVHGKHKDSPEIFKDAAALAGHEAAPQKCLFVGESVDERAFAIEAGMRVAPHPICAAEVMRDRVLRYIRIAAPPNRDEQWRQKLREQPVVPLYVAGQEGTTVYAIGTAETASALDDLGFFVDRLGDAGLPYLSELYLQRDDLQLSTDFVGSQGQSFSISTGENVLAELVLSSTDEGLFVALPAGRTIEDFHFEVAYHGHSLKLIPDPSLLDQVGMISGDHLLAVVPHDDLEYELTDDELAVLAEITPDVICGFLERYTGLVPLDDQGKIKSRHIFSSDNHRATEALQNDLTELDPRLCVDVHSFVHAGHSLDNVEGELSGETDELILITAHLDSTASFSPGPYNPAVDPAPGADDDGSGVASVLAAVQAIKKLSEIKTPKRSIRFVFFNAEEHGLVGSKHYARKQVMLMAPIVAVYQIDMIGYNKMPPSSWEIHAGFNPSREIQERSLVLADRIMRLQSKVSPELEGPQIYGDGDPAANRSDHASFQERGYAACVATEDFFIGPQIDSPDREPNPNYHQITDMLENVDTEFVADIARVITAAAWVTANI